MCSVQVEGWGADSISSFDEFAYSGFQIMVVIVVVVGCGGDMGTRPPDMVVVADGHGMVVVGSLAFENPSF
ncbi:hypothetical protein E3N88_41658 [Mikania micrantha]|uniref:Uncharacterized protein n=1 Tax=Mikania micrantha TaxID=192012 RepID=A0A5N6LK71_9ASTR|nr:hypothetical protein E3N88_41658 [Mikania micrantha]